MNGQELYDYYSSFSNKEEIVFPRWNPELRNANFDWWDLASQTGNIQEYNLSLSGGSEQLRSLVSVGVYQRRVLLRVMSIQGITFFIRLIIVRPTGSLSSLLFQVHAGISTTVSILFLQCTQLYHGTAFDERKYCRSLF